MHYLYVIHSDRRLTKLCDRYGCHLAFANKQLADDRAAYESTQLRSGLGVTLDTNPALHNTRDSKPCDTQPASWMV